MMGAVAFKIVLTKDPHVYTSGLDGVVIEDHHHASAKECTPDVQWPSKMYT